MAFTQTVPEFQCVFSTIDNPATPGFVPSEEEWIRQRNQLPAVDGPDIGKLVKFSRQVFNSGKLVMPDGVEIPHWGFRDDAGTESFPSPLVRINSGDLVQGTLHATLRQHTIHWHGIEPDSHNDGVGHTSFEVTGSYTYQWRAHPQTQGTYFYHCHVNTTLHVNMGLYGPLIVDPPGVDPTKPGPKKLFAEQPDAWDYDVEAIWAPTSIERRWHFLNHAAGMCGEDAGLNILKPDYFLINDQGQAKDGTPISAPNVAIKAKAGDNILIRTIHAAYVPITYDFFSLDPLLIENDGRPFRENIDLTGRHPQGPLIGIPWSQFGNQQTTSAARYSFLIQDAKPGVYPVELRFHHWVTGKVEGFARTTITVE
jgi:plastocyanin